MGGRRDRGTTALNLDSLTDTVTNLAGALVMLVILVLGLTRSGALQPPAVSGSERSERSIERLVEKVNRMRLEIKLVDQQVRTVEEDLPKLRERVKGLTGGEKAAAPKQAPAPTGSTVRSRGPAERKNLHVEPEYGLARLTAGPAGRATPRPLGLGLNGGGRLLLLQAAMGRMPAETMSPSRHDLQTQIIHEAIEEGESQLGKIDGRAVKALEELRRLLAEVQSSKPAEKSDVQAPEPPKPEEVVFRPPLEEFTRKEPLMIYCRDGAISFVDPKVVDQRVAKYLKQRGSKTAREEFQFDLPDSDVRCVVTLEGRVGRDLKPRIGIVRRKGARGESAEAIRQPGSKYKRVLALHQPQSCYVYFGVWPDSFELFRRAREIAWEAKYEVGWVPMVAGQDMFLGEGHGMTE